jgi:glycosyltransferase involved in cell wall biosynthesis
MWPMCGAEHYDDPVSPGRYREPYSAKNRPAGYRGPDLDAWVWRRKQRAWARRPFRLVSPSRWLAQCARESALLGRNPCLVIPNCVDTEVFKPLDRRVAREILNLDPDKRYILFGAMSGTSDPRKGFHLLQPALALLAARDGIAGRTELLVFGAPRPAQPPELGLRAHYLGNFHDDVSLALLYNAADVFAAPSMQDNLPNTLVEALACGTPCVAFAIGGMPDLIDPGETGSLAEPFSAEDFARGLLAALGGDANVRRHCRERACERWSPARVSEQYHHLYLDVLS